MENLSSNWFFEGTIDAELKEYILLAYLGHVEENFKNHKLYPELADLIHHLRNLKSFKENKNFFQKDFKKRLIDIDTAAMKLVYEQNTHDHHLMEEIQNIVDKSLLLIHEKLEEGIDIYDKLERFVNFHPVGIEPIYKNEGYLLVANNTARATEVYQYKVDLFSQNQYSYQAVMTEYFSTYEYSLTDYPENIKKDLVLKNKNLPNPSTYLIETKQPIPLLESLLPIVKRKLIHLINQ